LKELREPGQPDPLVELAELFNRESELCVQRVENASVQRDADSATRAAHSLKGSASNLGAHRLASLCAAMEQSARNREWATLPAQLNEVKTELARVREALQTEFQRA